MVACICYSCNDSLSTNPVFKKLIAQVVGVESVMKSFIEMFLSRYVDLGAAFFSVCDVKSKMCLIDVLSY